MTTIQTGAGVITQVNVFTVEPAHQQELVDILVESARFVSDEPGWLSANIHKSFDGKQVVNYAQSATMEAAQRVIVRLRDAGFFARTGKIATSHPCLCEVAFTLDHDS